jgi:hypothetical protein
VKSAPIIVSFENEDEPCPEWVTRYIAQGYAGVEALPEFKDNFCFIAEQSQTNLNVLLQWARNFNIEQDFPLLVFLRVYDRLTTGLEESPDYVYGTFFESALKVSSSTFWQEALQKKSYWVFVRNLETNQETYKMLILCVINKDVFKKKFMQILNDIDTNKKENTRRQTSAVNRLKYYFWDTF